MDPQMAMMLQALAGQQGIGQQGAGQQPDPTAANTLSNGQNSSTGFPPGTGQNASLGTPKPLGGMLNTDPPVSGAW